MHLIIESLLVGLGVAIFGFIISTLMMYTDKNFSFKKYHFWWQIILSYFVTGFLFHLIAELLKINKWYCKHGNACQ